MPHGTGAIQDRPDNRDYQWSEIGHASMPFDWSTSYNSQTLLQGLLNDPSFRLPIKDQDGSGSCGGQAWSYLAAVLEAIATKTHEERSAKFIYAQTYFPNGGGSTARDNATVFIKQGAAREAVLTSYDHAAPPTEAFMERPGDITDASRIDAKLDRSSSYAAVAPTIDMVAQAIRDTGGVILGINGQNNGTWSSKFPKPPTTREWGHWVCALAAQTIDGNKYIGFVNSWGTATGDAGWQWISEDYFTSGNVFSAWTHVYNPNPPPPSFSHNFVVDIEYASNGAEVVALQKALQLQGLFPSTVPTTGYYGDITRRAVLAFQVKFSVAPMSELLALNGRRAGVKTRAQLNALYNH